MKRIDLLLSQMGPEDLKCNSLMYLYDLVHYLLCVLLALVLKLWSYHSALSSNWFLVEQGNGNQCGLYLKP